MARLNGYNQRPTWTRATVILVSVATVVTLLASPTGATIREQPSSHTVASVKELRRQLVAAGISCNRFQDATVPGEPFATGMCILNGKKLRLDNMGSLLWYKSNDYMETILSDSRASDDTCPKGSSFEAAVGPNWAVSVENPALTRRIAKRLGGQVRTIPC